MRQALLAWLWPWTQTSGWKCRISASRSLAKAGLRASAGPRRNFSAMARGVGRWWVTTTVGPSCGRDRM